MSQIKNKQVQELFNAAINHYLEKKSEKINNVKVDKDFFDFFVKDLWENVEWPFKKVASLTLLNNYYFKSREKNKDETIFKGNYHILNAISQYTYKKDYFVVNIEVKSVSEKEDKTKKREENFIHLDFGTLLGSFKHDDISDFLDLPEYKNIWLQNESVGLTGFYQDREALDIVSQHLKTQMENGGEIADLSVVRECSLPYCIQSIVNKFKLNFKVKVLCFEEDTENKSELEKIGCQVFSYSRKSKHLVSDNLNDLGEKAILLLTNNSYSGVYARNKEIFNDDFKTYKTELFTDLLDTNSDYIYVPYKNGDVYENLVKVRVSIESNKNDKKNVRIIACSSDDNLNNKKIISPNERFIKLAKSVYGALKIKCTDFSVSPLACFFENFISNPTEITREKKYTILNIGVTNSHPFELQDESITKEEEAPLPTEKRI